MIDPDAVTEIAQVLGGDAEEEDADPADADPADSDRPSQQPQHVGLTPAQQAAANKITIAECIAFYRLVVVVATTFLGGTLLFIEKIAPRPVQWTLWFLLSGWVLLILSILCVVWVRRLNIEAGRCYQEENFDRSDSVQFWARGLTDLSGVLLGIGMLGVMLFGFFNFWASGVAGAANQENTDVRAVDSGHAAGRDPGLIPLRPAGADQYEPDGDQAGKGATASAQAQPSTVDPIHETSPERGTSSTSPEAQQVSQP